MLLFIFLTYFPYENDLAYVICDCFAVTSTFWKQIQILIGFLKKINFDLLHVFAYKSSQKNAIEAELPY